MLTLYVRHVMEPANQELASTATPEHIHNNANIIEIDESTTTDTSRECIGLTWYRQGVLEFIVIQTRCAWVYPDTSRECIGLTWYRQGVLEFILIQTRCAQVYPDTSSVRMGLF